jgi:hypothetical protein
VLARETSRWWSLSESHARFSAFSLFTQISYYCYKQKELQIVTIVPES